MALHNKRHPLHFELYLPTSLIPQHPNYTSIVPLLHQTEMSSEPPQASDSTEIVITVATFPDASATPPFNFNVTASAPHGTSKSTVELVEHHRGILRYTIRELRDYRNVSKSTSRVSTRILMMMTACHVGRRRGPEHESTVFPRPLSRGGEHNQLVAHDKISRAG